MPMPTENRTATFLLTDIEGSTRLWEEHGAAMTIALAAHDAMLEAAVQAAGGAVVKSTGDGILAVFDQPANAVAAALAGQRSLRDHDWPATGPLRIRMAIHTGTVEVRAGDFYGPPLNRVARLLGIGHGGQILLSSATAALVDQALAPSVELLDRGEHRLRDIEQLERVFQLVASDLPRDFPPLRSASPRSNLPVQLTSFIGREREIEAIQRLIGERRLVSLVGVGGTGKTRLMLRVAEDLVGRYGDGVWLVELAPVVEPSLVLEEIARVLSLPVATGQPADVLVTDFLREKDAVLLLDNCEHLIEPAARIVERLLAACPRVRFLVTSREALGVPGETPFHVPSLRMPEPDDHGGAGSVESLPLGALAGTESVRLFVDRALAVSPRFRLDESTIGSVVEICRRLDGIPLAIELAAARTNVLSVMEIAQGLGDRFRLLTGGRRTAVPRQQTLQALIDWSWDLLEEPDRRLLRRLSAFLGSWTLEGALEIARDDDGPPIDRLEMVDGLGRLVDRSLVVVEHAASSRYRMLETIRQYARAQLVASGEAVLIRDHHLALFRRLALEAEPHLLGPDLVAWLVRLDAEGDNLRAALDWAFETNVRAALEMSVALAEYWRHRSVGTEGVDRLQQAVVAFEVLSPGAWTDDRERAAFGARLLARAGRSFAITGRRSDQALRLADQAVDLARASGDRQSLVAALLTGAMVRVFEARVPEEELRPRFDEIIAVAQELGDWTVLSMAAAGRAMHEAERDPSSVDAWLDLATDGARRTGNPTSIAFAALARGRVLSYRRQLDEAKPWFEEAITAARAAGDGRQELVARSELAHATRRNGLRDEAAARYRETILHWQHLGQRGAIANQIEAFAFIASADGDPRRAAVLLGAAERLRDEAKAPMLPLERGEYEVEVASIRGALPTEVIDVAWAEGRILTTEEAVAFARAEQRAMPVDQQAAVIG